MVTLRGEAPYGSVRLIRLPTCTLSIIIYAEGEAHARAGMTGGGVAEPPRRAIASHETLLYCKK